MAPERIAVQVCYATPLHAYFRTLSVAAGSTIAQAIEASGVLNDIADIDLTLQSVGLYGKKRALDTVLREHDRIEIYRPLVADPKESRRRRAEKKLTN
ncbi:MAG: RnfH family protein [Bdellovibrionales bacterium]|nr:RnfH family protein [Massilia sp.]